MSLNGTKVNPGFNSNTGLVSFTPTHLTNGIYTINVSVEDYVGLKATKEWSFTVNVITEPAQRRVGNGGVAVPRIRVIAEDDVTVAEINDEVVNPAAVEPAVEDPTEIELIEVDPTEIDPDVANDIPEEDQQRMPGFVTIFIIIVLLVVAGLVIKQLMLKK